MWCLTSGAISVVNFYNWQKQLFENGAAAFERKTNSANARRQDNANAAKLEKLEAKLQQKNEVIAELLQEHVE
jgi:transposase